MTEFEMRKEANNHVRVMVGEVFSYCGECDNTSTGCKYFVLLETYWSKSRSIYFSKQSFFI